MIHINLRGILMEQIDFLSLIPYVFIISFTPGPNTITSASMGVCFGIRRTTKFVYGITVGIFIVMLLCGSFSNLLLRIIPSIGPIMRLVGAGYILWLAYGIFKATYSLKEKSETIPMGFYKGLLLQFLNPKLAIYGLTLYTAFLSPIINIPLYVGISVFTISAIAFCSVFTWALFGSVISKHLHNTRIKSALNITLGLLLVYTAVRLSGLLS